MLIISNEAKISDKADIEASIRGTKISIGKYSVIDSFVKIKPAGGEGDVIIGDYVYINSGVMIYTGHGVRIGNNVLIAANCTLASTNHAFLAKDRLIREQGFLPSKGGIIIEEDVWVGANSVILDGAYIPRGCVIAAGSLVRDNMLEPYNIYAGTPLRKIGIRK